MTVKNIKNRKSPAKEKLSLARLAVGLCYRHKPLCFVICLKNVERYALTAIRNRSAESGNCILHCVSFFIGSEQFEPQFFIRRNHLRNKQRDKENAQQDACRQSYRFPFMGFHPFKKPLHFLVLLRHYF